MCYTRHRVHCILKIFLNEGNYGHNIWDWFIDIHNKYQLAVGYGDLSTVSNIAIKQYKTRQINKVEQVREE